MRQLASHPSAFYVVSVRRLASIALRLPPDSPSRSCPCLRIVVTLAPDESKSALPQGDFQPISSRPCWTHKVARADSRQQAFARGSASTSDSLNCTAKARMLHKRFEVSVAMHQRASAFNTWRGDDRVNRLANRDAQRSQRPEVLRGFYCDVFATQIHDFQGIDELLSLLEITITRGPLQHPGQEQLASCKRRSSAQAVKFLGCAVVVPRK